MYANDAFCIINCSAESIHCRIFATNGKRRSLLGVISTYQEFYGMTGQSLMMCQVTDWK